ncbi:MAG: cell division protein FtsQ/DivIB [Polyangiales bacterium]
MPRPAERAALRPNRRRAPLPDAAAAPPPPRWWRRWSLWPGRRVCAQGLLLLVVLVGSWGTHHALHHAPAFSLRQLRIEGAKQLSEAAVLRQAQVARGHNLFSFDPAAVRRRLEAHPWVVQATVERRLPSRLRIALREHRAVAVLAWAAPRLLNAAGYPFKTLATGDPIDLPWVRGVDAPRYRIDPSYRTRVARRVSSFLQAYHRAQLGRELAEMRLDAELHLDAYIGGAPIQVRLGLGDDDAKLQRLRTVLQALGRRARPPRIVYLDNARRPSRVVVALQSP